MHKLGDDKPLALGESVSLDSVLRVLVGTKTRLTRGALSTVVNMVNYLKMKNKSFLFFIT